MEMQSNMTYPKSRSMQEAGMQAIPSQYIVSAGVMKNLHPPHVSRS
jgi:hypothetical protein